MMNETFDTVFAPSTAIGGAIGGLIGMYVFHHKTKHASFILGFRALALVQAAALIYLIVRFT